MSFRSLPLALALLAGGAAAAAAPAPAPSSDTTERIVVRFQNGSARPAAAASADTEASFSRAAGVPMKLHRTLASGAAVYRLEKPVTMAQARALAWRLRQDPAVRTAEPDVRVQAQSLDAPNDPGFARQWALKPATAGNLGGANFTSAWAYGIGSQVTVAVIDTGVLPTAELGARLLQGYDMVADNATGADGQPGRDADPTDPGDSCDLKGTDGSVISHTPSTWHGTRVATQLAATLDNGYGIAGAAPGVTVQPVRALGKCGGWMSDIADAVAWAAGMKVDGVPANALQPRVINLSLGGDGACTAFMQEAIDQANAKKIVVVTAAGNGGGNRLMAPANCSGVIVVGAHTRSGDLAAYSNFGPTLTITAPGGGNCAVQTGSDCQRDTTLAVGNSGDTVAAAENPAASFTGTSSATPHVSATVAMILSLHPEFGVREVRSVLERSARAAPAGTYCARRPTYCGGGMLDAGAALALASSAVLTPYVDVEPVAAEQRRGAVVPLSAVAVGASDFVWTWRQVSGPDAALLADDKSDVKARMPAAASGTLVFEAQAVSASDADQRATARVAVVVNEPPTITGRSLSAKAGEAMVVALSASDPEGEAVDLSYLGTTVAGLEVVDGELRWSKPVVGEYAFQVVAVDAQGASAGANFTLTVTEATATGGSDGAAGGGGGGATNPWWLLGLLAAAGLLRRR